jgi:hypothetical protein
MTDYVVTLPAQKPPSALVKQVSDITGDALGEVYRCIASGTPLYNTAAKKAGISDKCRLVLMLLESCSKNGCTASCTEDGRSISEQSLRNIIAASEREARHQQWLIDQGHD